MRMNQLVKYILYIKTFDITKLQDDLLIEYFNLIQYKYLYILNKKMYNYLQTIVKKFYYQFYI
jgi:hypothetical protein